MYELIQVGAHTYYIDCPAKMGIFVAGDNAWLIDSGNDKEAGKKAFRHIDEKGWRLCGVINTHSNADHTGGNSFLQQKTGCAVVGTGLENAFTRFPILEASFLYGGYPCKELRNKFLTAPQSTPTGEAETALPEGLTFIRLPGHYFDMIGIKTADDIWFLADSVFGENILNKYHLSFIYDVRAFLETLTLIEGLEGKLYVPAHAPATEDLRPLAQANRAKVLEIIATIESFCTEPSCFEEILKQVFDRYALQMDFNQYVLVGSTVRSYLAYLHDEGRADCIFEDNRLLWKHI